MESHSIGASDNVRGGFLSPYAHNTEGLNRLRWLSTPRAIPTFLFLCSKLAEKIKNEGVGGDRLEFNIPLDVDTASLFIFISSLRLLCEMGTYFLNFIKRVYREVNLAFCKTSQKKLNSESESKNSRRSC